MRHKLLRDQSINSSKFENELKQFFLSDQSLLQQDSTVDQVIRLLIKKFDIQAYKAFKRLCDEQVISESEALRKFRLDVSFFMKNGYIEVKGHFVKRSNVDTNLSEELDE